MVLPGPDTYRQANMFPGHQLNNLGVEYLFRAGGKLFRMHSSVLFFHFGV